MDSYQQPHVQMASWQRALLHPIKSLTVAFWSWKALLFLIIVSCPGRGYDTSATLLPSRETDVAELTTEFGHLGLPPTILKFVRWDSIYFLRIAERGYLFEQEWAFGYGYTRLLSFLTSVFQQTDEVGGPAEVAIVGVGLSHLTHFGSVLALYGLTKNVFGSATATKKAFCFLSASLHIISPAGAFLSAPYPEPVFSFLNLAGFYVYSSALHSDNAGKSILRDGELLLAAATFAVATTVRSNGILSGSLFAYDALEILVGILSRGLSAAVVRRLFVTMLSGGIVALGLIVPQYVAYTTYCATEAVSRPWCRQLIPSIYGWVQAQYWNVGFLRYWTVSNLPLFCLATPMLVILCQSSLWALKTSIRGTAKSWANDDPAQTEDIQKALLVRLGIAQAVLAVMAFTSYHVQIINRISSGYPLWYWYIISQVLDTTGVPKSSFFNSRTCAAVVQGMVMYGLIQAVLFGSFLPPA